MRRNYFFIYSLVVLGSLTLGSVVNAGNVDPATIVKTCLLYTSDAADERSSVDLGGRRIIKKKNTDIMWANIGPQSEKHHSGTKGMINTRVSHK